MQATLERPVKSVKKAFQKRPMSKEEAKYWTLWNQIFTKFNVPVKQREEWREDITKQLFGFKKSHKDFNHRDYDIMLGALRELLSHSQLIVSPYTLIQEYEEGERRRMVHLIDELDMPEPYIAKIAFNKFGSYPWRVNLFACELKHLFYTISARKRSADKKAKRLENSTINLDIPDNNCPF